MEIKLIKFLEMALLTNQFLKLMYFIFIISISVNFSHKPKLRQDRINNEFIGFVGFGIPNFESHFTPCVEIGWRLSFKHWGKGYATEAAKMALKIGFENFDLKEIVSFTAMQNLRSIAVMQKIGMTRDKNGDFNHPKLPNNHRLSRHVPYCIKNSSSSTKLGLFG